jgi:hypothetical protein
MLLNFLDVAKVSTLFALLALVTACKTTYATYEPIETDVRLTTTFETEKLKQIIGKRIEKKLELPNGKFKWFEAEQTPKGYMMTTAGMGDYNQAIEAAGGGGGGGC